MKTIMPSEHTTLQDCLFAMRKNLADAGIETAELDARLLMQAATGFDHAGLILNNNHQLKPSQLSTIENMVQRRINHEPVSRILGEREFYGRRFKVNNDVLDPRADTETLIDLALSILTGDQYYDQEIDILDIGTGSGAIIITLLCELPNVTGWATDISPTALAVTRENSFALGVETRLSLLETSWCSGIEQKFDMIVSNPPYIVSSDIENLSVDVKAFDPLLALDGGKDGLTAYRQIANQCAGLLKSGGTIILEIGFDQALDVIEIYKAAGFTKNPNAAIITTDLSGKDRVITMLWDQ